MGRSCPIYGTAVYLDCLDCDSKLCKSIKRKYSHVCIGIDQSYNNTGISIAEVGAMVIKAKDSIENIREQAKNVE